MSVTRHNFYHAFLVYPCIFNEFKWIVISWDIVLRCPSYWFLMQNVSGLFSLAWLLYMHKLSYNHCLVIVLESKIYHKKKFFLSFHETEFMHKPWPFINTFLKQYNIIYTQIFGGIFFYSKYCKKKKQS